MRRYLLLFIALAGCAQPQQFDWRMPNGSPPEAQKLQTAEAICKGKASTAMLSGTVSELSPPRDREFQGANVFIGCMAEQGILAQPVTAQR